MKSFLVFGIMVLFLFRPAPAQRIQGFNVTLPYLHQIKQSKSIGANWVSIVVRCEFQGNELMCEKVPNVRGYGLKVALKPHIEIVGGWRGDLEMNAAQWQSYAESIKALALTKPDLMIVGTELAKMSGKRALWVELTKEVRATCECKVTYAALWYEKVSFWDALDYIGIDAYNELPNGWQEYDAYFDNLAAKCGKPILLTEVGYQSRQNAHLTPWQTDPAILDKAEQKRDYRAVFEYFEKKKWWAGALWWELGEDEYGMGFTPLGKPAWKVLERNWSAPQ